MEQYYRASLYDPETKNHLIFKLDGSKMMEHCFYGNESLLKVEKYLLGKTFRVVWMGDYAFCQHYVRDQEPNIPDDSEQLEREEGKIYFLVNHTRKEFINLNKGETLSDIHPLPLLTKADGGIGGGDYRSETNFHYVGEWCGDNISIIALSEDIVPSGWIDCTEKYVFKE